jgi:lysozyme family protein
MTNPEMGKVREFTHRWEKGTVNHPDDPGGLTRDGVTQAAYNAWRKENGFDPRSVLKASQIELNGVYHSFARASKAASLPWPASLAHFDFSFHSGPPRATRFLQWVVDPRHQGTMPDGKWGPGTQRMVDAFLREHGAREMALRITERRQDFLLRLAEKPSSNFRSFIYGWVRRTNDLLWHILYE